MNNENNAKKQSREISSMSLVLNNKRTSISSKKNLAKRNEFATRLIPNRYDLLGTKMFRKSINKKKSLSEEKFDELVNKVNKSKSSKRSLGSIQSLSKEISINKSTVRGLYGLYQGIGTNNLINDNKNETIDEQCEESKFFLFSQNKSANEDNIFVNELKKCKLLQNKRIFILYYLQLI